MRNIIILLFVGTAAFTWNQLRAAAADESPLSVTIRALNDHPKVGDPITIEATIKNTSTAPVRIPFRDAEMDYIFSVRDPHGVSPQETERLKSLRDRTKPIFIFRNTWHILKPDESIQDTFEITAYYEFTDPGEYSIQVSRKYGTSKDVVASNTINVSVAAKQN